MASSLPSSRSSPASLPSSPAASDHPSSPSFDASDALSPAASDHPSSPSFDASDALSPAASDHPSSPSFDASDAPSPAASDHPSSASFNASNAPADASDASSDSSSDASSDSSSDASNPSIDLDVASVDEVRYILEFAVPSKQLKVRLAPDTSLSEAHKMWDLVRAEGGGVAELINPDMLSNKEEALQFVQTKLERLRRWKRHIDRKHSKVLAEVTKLEKLIDAGGPGVPAGYRAHRYNGVAAFIDAAQGIDDNDLGGHIVSIRALLLQGSPGSPATDGGHGSIDGCQEREEKEQLDIARFNLSYLQLKAKGLEVLSGHLVQGIRELEERFVCEPCHLGAGDFQYVPFIELAMYSGEAPKEP